VVAAHLRGHLDARGCLGKDPLDTVVREGQGSGGQNGFGSPPVFASLELASADLASLTRDSAQSDKSTISSRSICSARAQAASRLFAATIT
jgi:hypothetical protein